MLSYDHSFGDYFVMSDRKKSIYTKKNLPNLFTTVMSHQSVVPDIESQGLLSYEEINEIEAELGPSYPKNYGERIHNIKETLLEKTWFGFDLDDTLHEFCNASRAASSTVLELIIEQDCSATEEEL